MKMVTASGICSFNCLAPCTSMSSTRSLPRPGLLQNPPVGPVIVAENLGPFQKLAARDHPLELPTRNEAVALAIHFRARAVSGWYKKPKTSAPAHASAAAKPASIYPSPKGAEMMKTVVMTISRKRITFPLFQI